MQKTLATTRAIAIALGVLLIIAIIVIVHDHGVIKELRSPAQQNISAQADIIRQDCAGTDVTSQEKCANDLQALSDLLGKFSKNMHAGTTTPQ